MVSKCSWCDRVVEDGAPCGVAVVQVRLPDTPLRNLSISVGSCAD